MKDIVCFSSTRWNFLWQRPQQIMSRMAVSNRVLYIDQFVLIGTGTGIRFKGSSSFKKVHDNLYIFSPGYTTRHDLQNQLRIICAQLGFNKPILWTYYPIVVDILEKLDYGMLCYDCVDDFSLFSWVPRSFSRREERLLQECDVVFVTSKRLKKIKEEKAKRVYLVPNGADAEHFIKALDESLPVASEVDSIPKPVIGFIGALYEWIDFNLIRELCSRRPKWSFVFIGPVGSSISKVTGLDNVYIMGKRSYSALPSFLKAFDACIIPFKVNDLTKSVNPIKLYEYLAAGKPVVSTPIPEAVQYRHVVNIANNPREFTEALEKCIAEDNPLLVEERLKVAMENSWDNRVSVMEEIIEKQLIVDKR